MPTRELVFRTSTWLQMNPEQKDGTFLAAGFDPFLGIYDCGTTVESVKF